MSIKIGRMCKHVGVHFHMPRYTKKDTFPGGPTLKERDREVDVLRGINHIAWMCPKKAA